MSKEGVAIIGHNRAKTIGDNLAENAHPFVEDKTFAMVHNGTLHNHKQIGDTDVDSHALAIVLKKAMDEEDWKKGLEEALSKVKGAYACVWYDQKRDQVCMVRNAERPLFLVKAGSNTLFGSEVGLLTWIATRNNEKVDDIINTKVHTLYTFDMKKTGGDFSETNLTLKSPKTGFDNGTSKHNNGSGSSSKTQQKATTHTSSATSKFSVGSADKPLSKSEYKRLFRKMVGSRIQFLADDYIELEVDRSSGMATKVLAWGECSNGAFDLCEYNHIIRCQIDLEQLGIDEQAFYEQEDVSLSGNVYDMAYIKDEQCAIIRVNMVELVGESNEAYVH